jgi:hypothetical protein
MGDVDRRIVLVAQNLHQLRHDVRRSRQQGRTQRFRGDDPVQLLEHERYDRGGCGSGAQRRGGIQQPAEKSDTTFFRILGVDSSGAAVLVGWSRWPAGDLSRQILRRRGLRSDPGNVPPTLERT